MTDNYVDEHEVAEQVKVVRLPGSENPFKLKWFNELQPPKVRWLVKNFLPARGVGLMYGPSTVGKSFVMLNFVTRIARGKEIFGHRTRRAGVVYVAAEDPDGIEARLHAVRERYNVTINDLALISQAPNLADRQNVQFLAEAINEASSIMQENGGPSVGLVVIDTVAQSLPGGDENSSETMSQMLVNAQALGAATDALVMLIGHPGKDASKGFRGWSGVAGASDVTIFLDVHDKETDEDGLRVGRVEKLKNGRGGERFAYRLEEITVGTDEDGDPITTLVPKFEKPPAPAKKPGRTATPVDQKPGPSIIMRALQQLLDAGQGVPVPKCPGVSPLTQGVTRAALKSKAFSMGHAARDLKEESARRTFNRDIEALVSAKKLRMEGDVVWLL